MDPFLFIKFLEVFWNLTYPHHQLRITARRGAECVLTWSINNEDHVEAFAGQLVASLEVCFIEYKKVRTQKEKLWERYYTLRATKEFADNWASFFRRSDAAPSRTLILYQHITDIVFNHLIKEHYTTTGAENRQ
jgi:hypothetical protein